jgi:hypothetical protein
MLLCDAAQAVNGKLYILGAGWNMTGPDPSPSAIAFHIDVPWDQANRKHRLTIHLVTEDGQPALVPTPTGERPAEVMAEFEVGRPPGHRPGSALSVVLAVNIGPIPLKPDSRYEWRCQINGETDDDWVCGFSTRPAKQGQPTAGA